MLRIFFLITNILVALLLAITYLIPYVNPLEYQKIPILGIFYPALLISNVGFIIGWAFRRKFRYALLSFLVIALGGQHLLSLFGIPYFHKEVTRNEDAIEISSYNVRNFETIDWKNNNSDSPAIKDLIKHLGNSDYICAQEVGYNAQQILQKKLNYPYAFGHRGTMIFSHKPFLDKGKIQFGTSKNSCTWVDLPFGRTTIRLYSLHLESNHISDYTEKIARKEKWNVRNRVQLLREMFSQYLYRNCLRVRQTEQVLQHIANSPHPVVVCGDFNNSPLSYVYREFTERLSDGFLQKGEGLGISFGGYIPLLRIDYILADPNLEFQAYQIVRTLNYSDHYPTKAVIQKTVRF